jgi:HSP20 family protein
MSTRDGVWHSLCGANEQNLIHAKGGVEMPARNANRGRGGGSRGKGGSRQSGAGGRQGGSSASAASSRSESARSAGARGGGAASGGRSGGRSSSAAQTSRAAGRSGSSGGRGASSGASGERQSGETQGGTGRGGSARSSSRAGTEERSRAASSASPSAEGSVEPILLIDIPVSSGIAGGDLESGGIAAAASIGSETPRAGDVDAGLFGAPAPTSGGTASPAREREREIESTRESRTASASKPSSPATSGQSGGRVASRGRASPGFASWFAGAENPLVMMRRMQDDLDRVFRAFGVPRLGAVLAPVRELEEELSRSPAVGQGGQWSPQIEVFERDGNLVVHADLPAVRREDVEVDVDNDVLTIRGQRRHEHRDTEGGYRRTERSYGTFFRQIPLPEGVDPTEIEAAYQDGVLEVIIPTPRDPERSRRRIDIR